MPARPVIGLTAYLEPARWGAWDLPAVLLPANYTEAVVAAGGVPVLLPPQAPASVLARLDALVLTGGPDLSPSLYGASRHPATQEPRHSRDAAELALVAAAADRGMPVLGICRGLQVLNVSRGGTLVQHLPDVVGHTGHAPVAGGFGSHPVSMTSSSRLGGLLGVSTLDVPTAHHQAVAEVGTGLTPVAWAADGTVEAVEDPSAPFVVAVQWHPEAGTELALMRGLVAAS